MRKLLLVALMAPLLSACAPVGVAAIPPAPEAVAAGTVLDEQAALGVELAYQAAALALRSALQSGVLTGERAVQAGAVEARAYAAVMAVRAAYDAGNAASYADALIEARAAVAALLSVIKGERP